MKRALVALCFGLVALGATGKAWAKPTIAVLGLEVVDTGDGVDEKSTKMAKDLTDALRQRAKLGTGPFALAPGSDKDLLEMKLLSACDSEADDCMSAMGQELAADRLLFGNVKKRPNGYQVSLKLLNVDTKKADKTMSDVIPFAQASGADLTRWGKVFYNRLTGATDQGTLVIKANVDRGIVYLDGAVKGNLVGGTARITGLSEGNYQLAIEAEGHLRYEARVSVQAGQDVNHSAELETNALVGRDRASPDSGTSGPGATPGRTVTSGTVSSDENGGGGSRAMFWASLVATGVSGGAMTITGLQVRGSLREDKERAIRAYQMAHPADAERLDTADACSAAGGLPDNKDIIRACEAGKNRAIWTNVLIGTTVVGAAATILFYYKGYVEPRSSVEASGQARRNKRTKPAVSIVPALSPTQVGAGVRIDF